MNRCYLSLGSNQDCPERQLRQAIKRLKTLPKTVLMNVSSFHWTKPWGPVKQQTFCNAVVEIQTILSPILLLIYCNDIEKRQGRVRKKKYGPRSLDIDIILYANRRMKTNRLCIPHPHFRSRNYVLMPLLELADENLAKTVKIQDKPKTYKNYKDPLCTAASYVQQI